MPKIIDTHSPNYPMIEGAQVELRVGKDMVELHTIEY